jgi:Ca2+-binding EF-hand superfamily protein
MEQQAQKKVVKNPEELRKVIFEHFQPIFKKVDQKGHDAVEEPELKLLIAESLLKNVTDLTNEEFEKYQKLIDKNNTGKITYEDYVNC